MTQYIIEIEGYKHLFKSSLRFPLEEQELHARLLRYYRIYVVNKGMQYAILQRKFTIHIINPK